jgi:hypothetical protein
MMKEPIGAFLTFAFLAAGVQAIRTYEADKALKEVK